MKTTTISTSERVAKPYIILPLSAAALVEVNSVKLKLNVQLHDVKSRSGEHLGQIREIKSDELGTIIHAYNKIGQIFRINPTLALSFRTIEDAAEHVYYFSEYKG